VVQGESHDQTVWQHAQKWAALWNAGRRLRNLAPRWRDPHNELQLPGGGIDPGESPLRALHREVFEETGWHIARPRRLGAFRRFTFMPDYDRFAEKLCHVYVVHPVRRIGPPSEPNHKALWVDPAMALQNLANVGDAAFLADYVAGL
jgi:8-oxo-dGTP diphosphatase